MIDYVLSSNITIITNDSKNLKKLLDLEMSRKKYSRSDSEVVCDGNSLIINIFAKDVIALKATINNYINILELIKKVHEVDL